MWRVFLIHLVLREEVLWRGWSLRVRCGGAGVWRCSGGVTIDRQACLLSQATITGSVLVNEAASSNVKLHAAVVPLWQPWPTKTARQIGSVKKYGRNCRLWRRTSQTSAAKGIRLSDLPASRALEGNIYPLHSA